MAPGGCEAPVGSTWRLSTITHHLVMTNIAMDNDPFIDGLPITNGDFPWLC